MRDGEESVLPARGRGPQKRYVRDYVDARLSIGEALLPFLFIVIIATIIPSQEVVAVLYIVVYGFITVAIVDVVVLGAAVAVAVVADGVAAGGLGGRG